MSEQARAVHVVQRFTGELEKPVAPEMMEPEMLPSRLARACVCALQVDGAGIGVYSDPGIRVPVGGSDPRAVQAERLQFSLGVGPSAEARTAGRVLMFTKADLDRNWQFLSASLGEQTPFEAVLAVPLQGPLAGVVVLDLYLASDQRLAALDPVEVDTVVGLVTGELVRATLFGGSEGETGPGWMEGADVRRRSRVWQAMGMVTLSSQLDSADALAALRARAFTCGRLVDDLCADIVAGLIPATSVVDDHATG